MNARVRVLSTSQNDLAAAAQLLRHGGVVAFPTETVYGLGANAFDAAAVARIFEAKARPSFDPLIVHIARIEQLQDVAADLTQHERALIDAFWPGPLTLVVPKRDAIPGIVTAGLPTVGVRMPSNAIARALIDAARAPLAAPSANPFGYLSPTRAEHVARMLDGRIDAVVDGGPTERGVESTIVALRPHPQLLRYGALAAEEIERVTGPLERALSSSGAPVAPGQLQQHYSPRTPIRIVEFDEVDLAARANAAALAFRTAPHGYRVARVLSPEGDMRTAAAHLFEYLHELDAAGVEHIDAQRVPSVSVGDAINDRLLRAAAR